MFDAPWIGQSPYRALSPIEDELTDELDALRSVLRRIDELLDTAPHAESLASLGYQVQERVEEIERDLRSIRYSL